MLVREAEKQWQLERKYFEWVGKRGTCTNLYRLQEDRLGKIDAPKGKTSSYTHLSWECWATFTSNPITRKGSNEGSETSKALCSPLYLSLCLLTKGKNNLMRLLNSLAHQQLSNRERTKFETSSTHTQELRFLLTGSTLNIQFKTWREGEREGRNMFSKCY